MSIEVLSIKPRQKLTIAKGLCDYQFIMKNWQTNSKDFKEVYYEFYLKARWAVMSNVNYSSSYFNLLQKISPTEDLISALKELNEEMEHRSFEFSLVSKMLHTRNPIVPIYDSKVKQYLSKEENVEFWWNRSKDMYGSPAPRGTSKLDKIKHDWKNLCEWYSQFLSSSKGKEWVEWFDNNFPAYKSISNVKKVDFIIFAVT
ncbi:MAG: hypothetical protein ACI4HJ_03420 [Ruminococcus sp.]